MRRDPKLALAGAAACLAGLVLTGIAALLWPAAQARDADALNGLVALNRGGVAVLLNGIAHLANPGPYAIFTLGLIAIALARGRRRLALALPVVLVGAELTTQLLKPLLATSRTGGGWWEAQISAASWPSGHATAALAVALCAVLVAPRRLRPAVAFLGALFAVAVAYSILILAWHFPSDVLGGFFVATTWVLAAVAVLLALDRRRPERTRPASAGPPVLWPIELAVGVAAGAIAAVALWRPEDAGRFAAEHTSGVAMLAVIVALALALAGGVARTVQR